MCLDVRYKGVYNTGSKIGRILARFALEDIKTPFLETEGMMDGMKRHRFAKPGPHHRDSCIVTDAACKLGS
jgi:hypothetical protein